MPQQPNIPQVPQSNFGAAVDAAAAYQEHLVEARLVEVAVPYRLVPDVVLANVKIAERFLAARRDEIAEHLPKVHLPDLEGLGRLALGFKFAAMQADGIEPSENEINHVMAEARDLRGKLLPAVKSLAAAGLVPQATYDRIARGRGARDTAEDCVSLAQVFRERGAALEGKHPITPEQVDRAALVGSWLLQNMKVAGARAEKAPPPEAVEIRNRMAALLSARYAKLQAAAHYFEPDTWEEVVPPLMSRPAPRRAKAERAPEPAAPPAQTQTPPAQEPPASKSTLMN